MVELVRPPSEIPPGVPDWSGPDSLNELKSHLQTAVRLELHTIPLYLFAMYSIKDQTDDSAVRQIRHVVLEEMLHMGLAGNILCSIGGSPKVYGHGVTPGYPCWLFYDNIPLALKPATKETIGSFVSIERPEQPVWALQEDERILSNYHSIGAFYRDTMIGLQQVSQANPKLFDPNTASKQFRKDDGSWDDANMTVITDLKSAVAAMNVIVEQGEGSQGVGQDGSTLRESHYEFFKSLHEKFDGEESPFETYPLIEKPNTERFAGKDIYSVMIACDAIYSYLLLTIEKLWTYGGPRRKHVVRNNLIELMRFILTPFARFLVSYSLGNGENAAPAFKLYPFTPGESALAQLRRLTSEAFDKFDKDTEEWDRTKMRRAIKNLDDLDELKD